MELFVGVHLQGCAPFFVHVHGGWRASDGVKNHGCGIAEKTNLNRYASQLLRNRRNDVHGRHPDFCRFRGL